VLPAGLGARGRYVHAGVFLALLPEVRRWHRARAIPDDISWTTLADFGQQVAIHRWLHGTGGLSAAYWLTLHFRGALYRLGRLQFNRLRIAHGAVYPLHWYGPAVAARLVPGSAPATTRSASTSRWASR